MTIKFSISTLFSALMSAIVISTPVAAETLSYEVIDLGVGFARAINDSGQVTGRVNDQAFLYDGATVHLLDSPGIGITSGYGINNSGSIVAIYTPPYGANEVAVYAGGAWTSYGTLFTELATPGGINDTDTIVGSYKPSGGGMRAFTFVDGTVPHNLGVMGTGGFSLGLDINNAGWVTGYGSNVSGYDRAFIDKGAGMIDLGTLGGFYSTAYGINEDGDVVGKAHTPAYVFHAFFWDGTNMNDLGTLGSRSYALSVNDSDYVVGESTLGSGEIHAFIHDGSQMYDLNDLVISTPGMTITRAWDINESGWIAGMGDLNGETHALLLRPAGSGYTLGDINLDGQVNIADYLLLTQYVLGTRALPDSTSWEFLTADMNADGLLNTGDMVILQRTILE